MKYSERFIINNIGDSSVGLQSFDIELDVIANARHFCFDNDEKTNLTNALKDFLKEYFENCARCDVLTFSEQLERDSL